MVPLETVVSRVPAVASSYHLILFPVDVAFRFELWPARMVEGVAVAGDGADIPELIEMVITLLLSVTDPEMALRL